MRTSLFVFPMMVMIEKGDPILVVMRDGKRYNVTGFSMSQLKHTRRSNGNVKIRTDAGFVTIEGKEIRSLSRQ